MRTILKISMDMQTANKAIQDGSLPKIMRGTMEKLKPEASYFYTEAGKRTGFMIFDMKDPSEMPQIAEPLFIGLGADVTFSPVMNPADLERGLTAFQESSAGR